MKAYLDNNVFVDIESGNYSIDMLYRIPGVEYYYSDAHLNELLEAKGNPKVSQERRLDLITRICGQNYICANNEIKPEFLVKDCRETHKLVDNPLRAIINKIVSERGVAFDLIRERIGFESIAINNEGPEQILRMIDERMQERLGLGLLEYLCQTEALGRALYVTLMNIVDLSNYWKDKQTAHSDIARLCDASHAYSAQICDVLVTGDKKMRAKVKAVYSFLKVNTKVISVDDFLVLVQQSGSL